MQELRRKASLAVLLLTVTAMLGVLAFGRRAVWPSIEAMERRLALEHARQLRQRLQTLGDHLRDHLSDYANWDAAQDFLLGRKPVFPTADISVYTFRLVDALAMWDRHGVVRLARSRPGDDARADVDSRVLAVMERARALLLAGDQPIVLTKDVSGPSLLLVAAARVLPSSGGGESAGVMAMCQQISPAAVDALLHESVLGWRLLPPNAAMAWPRPSDVAWVEGADEKSVSARFLWGDRDRSPVGVVEVRVSRTEFIALRTTVQYALLGLLALVAVAGITAAVAVDRAIRTDILRRGTEERYRAVTETSPDAILALRDGRVVSWNAAARHLFGYETGEIIGRPVALLFGPAAERLRWRSDTPVQSRPVELKARRKNGLEVPVEVSVGHWSSVEGRFSSAIVRDITERRQAEEALRASETRYRVVADNTANWELWLAPDGRVLYMSPAGELITGRTIAEFVSDPTLIERIAHPDDAPRFGGHLRQMLSGGRDPLHGELEYRIVRPDGEIRWLSHTCLRVFDSDGTFLGVRSSGQDITARKQAEAEAQRLEERLQLSQRLESLGVMAGGIAHDFNNLLAGILGNAELAIGAPPAESRECLAAILDSARRASELIRQMLAYAGRASVSPRPINLSDALRDSLELLRTAAGHRVDLQFDPLPNLPPIEADPVQVNQIALNLVQNAADAMEHRAAPIRLRLFSTDRLPPAAGDDPLPGDPAAGPWVGFEVSDEGHGIAPDIRPRIFEPFFSTRFQGRGLGLSAVLGILRAHRGALRIQSEPGRGTTVRVFFPAARETLPTPSPPPPATRRSGAVLVVDDEAVVRDVAARMVRRLGWQADCAADGEEGLRMFEDQPDRYDVVLLDWTMPRRDGRSTLSALRRLRPDIPVILSSGFNDAEIWELVSPNARVWFMSKPFRFALLEEILNQACPPAGGSVPG